MPDIEEDKMINQMVEAVKKTFNVGWVQLLALIRTYQDAILIGILKRNEF